ncbi:two-component system OmpR family response regulator/two-component system response regulator MprA [Salinibacter ruber]|uniref:response regulator transcription factor n=1 Tax=Salinibacter ruber TaxID=146919 RepID=UPI000E574313|nr:response regulator transcription factor [Salinibacter ruber]MCS4034614.1 two-component system OmpR family response regulator/two-component system response regulator MprA [Salinibacter ruber]
MSDAPHLLLVEDEPDVASFVQQGLNEEGYEVSWVEAGRRGLDYARQGGIDLVLLDIRLPDLSGLEVCERLRLHRPELPILMLTALDAVEDRVRGLRAGADDYLPKPFAFDELLARIEALLRRVDRPSEPGRVEDGPLVLDPAARTCTFDGEEVDLTPTEFDLLAFLMARNGQALSRDTIHQEVWGHDFDRGTNLIDVYVNYVRRKLDEVGCEAPIETVRGIGYRYTAYSEADASADDPSSPTDSAST